ncbi:MAG: tetratricopeptide repeat protein [Actinophytocola sp.]|uniref:tetratricopeptide repeat protein n=1 Tax=Actinophytocola sp. TaxID=1872138 RepID=UPI0013242149|nr:tetratricopeptide repeat protein [Actinophytocola sp.]MPZ86126.1 tetratricopeptide repeat protein [Actinophytocola sp.]
MPRAPHHFQPPADVLHALAEATGSTAVVCSVTDGRGVGKTQAAGAYARQRVADGWLVAWIPAQTKDLVVAGLVTLADALGLRTQDDTAAAKVRDHLQTRTAPALLVFDNVTDPAHVIDYLPAAGSAQIVLTSASHAMDRVGVRVPVDLFAPETAVRYLTESTGRDDPAGAAELAAGLGCLPLALAQAAASITRHHWDYPTYLRRLREVAVAELLDARPGDQYPHGAAEAILLAVEPFLAAEPTRGLLDLLSVLSPDGVSRRLLPDADAVADLVEASLVEEAGPEGSTVVMHRLTQRVLRERAGHDLAEALVRAAELVATTAFPAVEAWDRRDLGDELIRHIDALWTNTGGAAPVLTLRLWAVRQLIESAATDRAIDLATALHADHQRINGPDHVGTFHAAVGVAQAYTRAGRAEEILPLLERTLEAVGRMFPGEVLEISSVLDAFGSSRPEDVVPYFEGHLGDIRRDQGDDHPDTLTSVDNLARAYLEAGRVSESVVLFERNLGDRRRVLGEGHPHTLVSANNLGLAYWTADRLDESLPLLAEALDGLRQAVGESHHDTLAAANNLAHAMASAGRTDEAVAIYERTVALAESALGSEHPTTTALRDSLREIS